MTGAVQGDRGAGSPAHSPGMTEATGSAAGSDGCDEALADGPAPSPAAHPPLRRFVRPQACALPPSMYFDPESARSVSRAGAAANGVRQQLLREERPVVHTGPPPGARGLVNLGLTCFMNSAVQCISNLTPIRDFLLSDAWREDVNPDNPLGCKGELAVGFAALLERLWTGPHRQYVDPYSLHRVVCKHNYDFADGGQHDAHEFMNWFLDNLHEDLNRVKVKKFVEYDDLSSHPDEEHADVSWQRHLNRNQSRVQETFTSMMRSRMRCNTCGQTASRFEPQMCLALGLRRPADVWRVQEVVLYYASNRQEGIRCALVVRKDCSVAQFKRALAEVTRCDKNALHVVAYTTDDMTLLAAENYNTLNEFNSCDLYVYELPSLVQHFADEVAAVAALAMLTAICVDLSPGFYEGQAVEIHGVVKRPELNGRFGIVTKLQKSATGGPRVGVRLDDVKLPLAFAPKNLRAAVVKAQKPVRLENDTCILRILHHRVKMTARHGPAMMVIGNPPLITMAVLPASSSDEELYLAAVRSLPPAPDSWDEDIEAGRNWHPSQGTKPPFSIRFDMRHSTCDVPYDHNMQFHRTLSNVFRMKTRERDRREADVSAPKTLNIDLVWSEYEPSVEALCPTVEPSSNPKAYEDAVVWAEGQRAETGELTLEQCLAHHTMEEELDDLAQWDCPRCKEGGQTYKQMSMWTPPECLVILLKRFSYASGLPSQLSFLAQRKINTPVAYPARLDMSPYMSRQEGPLMYDLHGVVRHFGNSYGGHYTALSINPENQQWYSFDDERAFQIEARHALCKQDAYVLCYRRSKDVVTPGQSPARSVPRSPHAATGLSDPSSPTTPQSVGSLQSARSSHRGH
eukprot:TRINITY_DN3232_c0_g1_i1.p1 TRINITY_DN3232_c0_g1~~TRINITY_DN3232_c0_g1_i1.p1  ORF type:complete len:873 (+),score=250.45 TRINITY_DN3232_c0_g1_i1:57-2621(+)